MWLKGFKTEEMASGGSCTAKVHLYFPKLEGSLLFRLVWREPHSAIPILLLFAQGSLHELVN